MKQISTRIKHKHATEAEWNSSTLIPLIGELIIYDEDTENNYKRLKIGDGQTVVSSLPFFYTDMFIDYDELSFDTSEIVLDNASSTTSMLGKATLGQMILA